METNLDPCKSCGSSVTTEQRLSEIHEAIVGTTEKSGLVGRTERLEQKVSTNTHVIGLAVLALVGFAFDKIIT
jgi:hypothetical protein